MPTSNAATHPTLTEKGLLTPDNCVLAMIDFQPQMLFGVANFDRQDVINKALALAKASRVFQIPTILTTVETASFSGYMWPQLSAIYPGAPVIERSSMNSWDDANFVAAVQKTGRKKLIIAGLWTEVCVTFPAIQALHDGYDVYFVADACGDVSEVAHDMAVQRCIQAGVKPLTVLQTMLEWQRDWAHRGTYNAVCEIAKQHFGAYGVGIEYAYTMVHKVPETKYPEYVPPIQDEGGAGH